MPYCGVPENSHPLDYKKLFLLEKEIRTYIWNGKSNWQDKIAMHKSYKIHGTTTTKSDLCDYMSIHGLESVSHEIART